jgi:glycerol-3-phosphate cytidylyltransferase
MSTPLPNLAFTIGGFDLLHEGHVNLLGRMRALAGRVVVGLATDNHLAQSKGVRPHETWAERAAAVAPYADEVVPVGYPVDAAVDELVARPDWAGYADRLYVRGDDWADFPGRARVERHFRVAMVPYTRGVSSTQRRAAALAARPYFEVVRAWYGAGRTFADVTAAVLGRRTADGGVDVPVTNKAMGCDPARGRRKHVRLLYRLGRTYSQQVADEGRRIAVTAADVDRLRPKVEQVERRHVPAGSPLRDLLRAYRDALEKVGCRWWLEFGTALGAARDRDLVPHDHDVDVGVLLEGGLTYARLLAEVTRLARDFPPPTQPHHVRDFKGLVQTVTRDTPGRCYGDFWAFARGEDGVVRRLCPYAGTLRYWPPDAEHFVMPDRFLGAIGPIRCADGDYPVPLPAEEFAAYRYGGTYRYRTTGGLDLPLRRIDR